MSYRNREIAKFAGKDVAVTLNYTSVELYSNFNVFTATSWNKLTPLGNTTLNANTGTITFVLKAADIEKAVTEGIMFQLFNAYFTKATLREATADDYYVGDGNTAVLLNKAELKASDGHAKITVTFRTIANYNGYDITFQLDGGDYSFLGDDAFVDGKAAIKDGDTTATIVISRTALDALEQNLRLCVRGVIVENYTLGSVAVESS
jgi:hypothetical protein